MFSLHSWLSIHVLFISLCLQQRIQSEISEREREEMDPIPDSDMQNVAACEEETPRKIDEQDGGNVISDVQGPKKSLFEIETKPPIMSNDVFMFNYFTLLVWVTISFDFKHFFFYRKGCLFTVYWYHVHSMYWLIIITIIYIPFLWFLFRINILICFSQIYKNMFTFIKV